MIVAVVTTWAVTIGQMVVLNRRLKAKVPAGPKRYEAKTWFATSIPIFVVEGFYLLLTYVDILALEHFRSPDEVAVYYAGARLLAIVAFVYFAIAGATTHKFTEYHVAGDKERLAVVLRRDHQVDVLALARGLRADPRFRAAAARPVRRELRARLWRDVHPGGRHARACRGRPGRTAAQHAGRAQAMRLRLCHPPSRSISCCA